MVITTIDTVDLAGDVKTFVRRVNVGYRDSGVRDKILKSDDNSFLKVTKTIGSDITIIDAVDVDDAYIERMVRGI